MPPALTDPAQSTIDDLEAALARPWMHAAVYAREQSGQGAFLAEFRPAVALFLRFSGIDYDHDTAGAQEEL